MPTIRCCIRFSLGSISARAEDIDVLVPMVPHLTWYQLFPQILVLDATATLTDFLYPATIRS